MTQPNLPDRPHKSAGEPPEPSAPGPAAVPTPSPSEPVEHGSSNEPAGQHGPAGPDGPAAQHGPARPHGQAGQDGSSRQHGPAGQDRPAAQHGPAPRHGPAARSAPGPAASSPSSGITRRSVTARLVFVLPIACGALLVEAIFATRGERGDIVSLPAAVVALLLLWVGVAWALRSWVVLLMTFVPAVLVTLGAALVTGLAPGAGGALLLVGLGLIGAIVSFRLSAPERGWTPGWSTGPRTASGPFPAVGSWPADPPRGRGPGGAGPSTRAPRGDGGDLDSYRGAFRPLDPLGAHFLHPGPAGPPRPGHLPIDPSPAADDSPVDRPAPAWDTSATDRGARDRLVAELCRRGGTTGPTLATLEEFFTGNGDPRSIAPGLREAVPLGQFHAVLRRLRERPSVAEVLVQIEPLEAGRYPAGEWPVAGSVHVIASLDAAELDAIVKPLQAESVIGPLPVTELTTGVPAPSGSGEYALWWA